VTEGHFFRFHHITPIQIFVANLAFKAGITSAHAPGNRITDLLTGTEQTVVRTVVVIGSVHTCIVDLVTGIHRTVHPVVAVNRSTRQACTCAVAGLLAVTELSIRTGASSGLERAVGAAAIPVHGVAVVTFLAWIQDAITTGARCRITGVCGLVADRSRRTWITGGGTVSRCITELGAVTEQPIIRTVGVIGSVHTGIVHLVAGIIGTSYAVIAVHRSSRLTGSCAVAGLLAVTELAIRAGTANRLKGAVGRTAVTVQGIAVVTIFARFDDAVAAYCSLAVGIIVVVEIVAVVVEPNDICVVCSVLIIAGIHLRSTEIDVIPRVVWRVDILGLDKILVHVRVAVKTSGYAVVKVVLPQPISACFG
jgi:hypothetical protein